MGFKSVMKKVGKVALKAAPFALDFVPGGQFAHLAMAAGLGAATAKGGVKSRLLGAGMGAGAQYAGHLIKGGGFNPMTKGSDITRNGLFNVGAGSKVISGGGGSIRDEVGNVAKQTLGGVGKKIMGEGGNVAQESIAHKLFSNPATYMAALSAFRDPSAAMPNRAYRPGEFEALTADNGNSYAATRLKDPSNYHTASKYIPSPINVGALQIGGGLATSPEEEALRQQQAARG